MQAPPLYHTTGEVLDVISAPGLERIARFLASFVVASVAHHERINARKDLHPVKRISVLGTLVLAGALTVAVAAQQPRRRSRPSTTSPLKK